MKLLHSPGKTKQKFEAINNILKNLQPTVKNILYNMTFTKDKVLTLNSIDLYEYIKDIKPKDLDLQSKKIINRVLKQNDIKGYERFLSDFTPVTILVDILKNYTKYEHMIFKYKTNTININLHSSDYTDYNSVVLKAIKVFTVLEYCNLNDKIINITYAPTLHTKLLPLYKILGPISVNSGVTAHRFLDDDIHMTIYRKEESDKVVLHELIHYLKLDFALLNNDSINNLIVQEFNISKDTRFINLFEAFTDSIAIIFNSITNCILLNKNINDYFQLELQFIESQMNKILKFFNFKSPKELLDQTSNKSIIQNTSVLSYYILKYFLMISSEKILTEFFPIKYTDWTHQKISDIYRLAKYNLSNYKKSILKKKFKGRSLRMSYNEIIY
jgi:hypothetical protein